MEDETDIQPPPHSQPNESDNDNKVTLPNPRTTRRKKGKSPDKSSIPLYEDLQAIPPAGKSAAEQALVYAGQLQNAPGFPWHHEMKHPPPAPVFEAPFITGADPEGPTDAQLHVGIYINIPRSPKLWFGDHLKLRWGHNTFYTTIGKVEGRKGPRLVQYLNNETLADYESGCVEVRYEVVRRAKLVGISETLTVNLPRLRKRRGKGSPPGRPPRRRRMQPKP
ncbi:MULTISPECIES: hypothetical protein [unclassified Pseudomonas]|jgi:hypothetical protein|uniref:hypothetical protein n=1 Tax=unclassified Pseudomonas TaxID=196821 RepID=UPI00249B7ABF|nr:hypothetical protein [Pseudomonas sp. PS02290]